MNFPATRHSVILAAGSGDPEARRRAYASIVEAYWKPAYKFTRLKWRAAPEEAEDLIQAFFARGFEKNFFATYDPQKARFRTFFRTCLDGFVANERKAAQRLKRGGAIQLVPLDFTTAEGELRQHDIAVPADMEAFFDHEWARSILALAVDRVRVHYTSVGREKYFRVFERYDLQAAAAGERVTYAELGRELGIHPTDITNYLSAARRQFRASVLERLRELTATEDEFRDEAKRLLGVDV